MVSMAIESEEHTIWAPGISSLVCVCMCVWGKGGRSICYEPSDSKYNIEDYMHVVRKQDSVQSIVLFPVRVVRVQAA